MIPESLNLPDSVPELHSMLTDLRKKESQIESENKLLREEVKLLRQRIFGRKSEKYSVDGESDQTILFDDAELTENADDSKESQETAAIAVKPHTRKKSGRKPLPADLPRKEIIHDIPEEEKTCGCGHKMVRIGDEVSEKLAMIPADFYVERHIRHKYACRHCEGSDKKEGEKSIKIAPVPEQLLEKSICSSSLLAHIVTAKFSDSLPLYRQEKQFKRYGIDISRSVMCKWLLKVWLKCSPLLNLLREELLSGPLIHADETTVQVLMEEDRSASSKSYMWVYRGGPRGQPVIFYNYSPSRSGSVAAEFLKGYKGIVQTDGYAGYNFLDSWPDVIHAGCWSHVRRKFMEMLKIGTGKSSAKVKKALRLIGKLYQIEKEARFLELSPEELVKKRQSESKPVVEEFEQFLQKDYARVLPQSTFGKAVFYSLNQLPCLKVFLDDPVIPLDNNPVENAVRPFALGRKNWLFSYHKGGAEASAFFYSLIETAKANGVEPHKYLLYLFDNLPRAITTNNYKSLLPQNLIKN